VTAALVDTSVWARRSQPAVGEELARAIEADEVAVIQPIVLELLRSARDAAELDELAFEYDTLQCLDLTSNAERRARSLQRALALRGHHRGPSTVDLLAAAAAAEVGIELWHCDRHFELIAELTDQPMRRLGT
jgi:predicted nucleic acid-binding protein